MKSLQHSWCFLLPGVCSLAGCVGVPIAVPSAPPNVEQVCSTRREIAYLGPGGSCGSLTLPNGWSADHLFNDGMGNPHPSPELRGYCVLTGTVGLSSGLSSDLVEDDCHSVTPQVFGPSSLAFKASFHRQTGGPAAWSGQFAKTMKDGRVTRVALVDTAHDSNDGDFGAVSRVDALRSDPDGHAFALGHMIRELSGCRADVDPDCRVALDYRRGLPLRTVARAVQLSPPNEGGYFGYVSDLAVAIVDAVDGWKAASNRHPNLVINLSVGWLSLNGGRLPLNPGWLSDRTQGPGSASRAVAAALGYAACHGALTFAAAGNQTGGRAHNAGPLYPAAWERSSAPTWRACQEDLAPGLLTKDIPASELGSNRPLVYAVSAVDYQGRDVVNARPESTAALTAFGHWAVAEDDQGGPTRVMTGSSVATAVVSAAAAAVWSKRPQVSAKGVAELLVTGGCPTPLGMPASPHDYWFAGQIANTNAVRVTLRRAVEAATLGPSLPSCDPFDPPPTIVPESVAVETKTVILSSNWVQPSVCARVDQSVDYNKVRVRTSPFPCPDRQLYGAGALPLTGPQPTSDPCDDCGFGGGTRVASLSPALTSSPQYLYLKIDSAYAMTVSEPVLYVEIQASSGAPEWKAVELSHLFQQRTPAPGTQYQIEGLKFDGKIIRGYLAFTLKDASGQPIMSSMSVLHVQ